MINKYIFSLIALLFSMTIAFAQTGAIKGTIKTSDGVPAEFVNIELKGTKKLTVANGKGEYEIKNIEPGNYVLIIQFIGLETQETNVEVKANETTVVPEILLKENIQQLQEVVISESRSRKESDYVSKMPLKNIENPQVYSTIDSKILKEQIVTNFADALKNAPGIEKLWESTGRGGDGGGYYSLRGFAVQPNLVNGLPGLTNGSLDPINIERIEVFKGPSGTLFGSSLVSYGGLINTVTKKPYEKFGGELSYIVASFGLNRITADVNAPLNKKKDILLRVNTAYHTENSFQDAGFRKSFVIAPTLSYKVTKKLSFLVVTEFLETEGTNPTMLFLDRDAPVTHPNLAAFGYDNKRSYTSNNLSIKNPTSNLQAQMNYKLSDKWTSQTIVSSGSTKTSGYYSYLYESSQYYPIDGVVMGRYVSNQNSKTNTIDLQQNFIGNFFIGKNIKNKMVAGLDYYQNTSIDNGTDYVGNGIVYIGNADQQMVYDSVFGGIDQPTYDSGVLSAEGMNNLLATAGVSNSRTKQETYSTYVSDVIAFEPIRLSAMVSLRYDYFDNKGTVGNQDDNFSQSALSPKFGLIYQPFKDRLSVFANYMDGFSNVAPAKVADADGGNSRTKTFEPEHANQLEFGIKTDLKKDRLTSSISYYNIQVDNKVMVDPTNVNNQVQGGKVESKGFELDLRATPIVGLDVIIGYAHNESTVLKGTPGVLFSFLGRRPSEAGPQNLFNAWATYKLPKGLLKGFGIGFGTNAASERLIMDSELTGKFALPAYTILNTSVFYYSNNFGLTLKVDNLTNEEYYKGWTTINPQRPRSVAASFTYKF